MSPRTEETDINRLAAHLAYSYLKYGKGVRNETLSEWFCHYEDSDRALWEHVLELADEDEREGAYMGGLRGKLRACLLAGFGEPPRPSLPEDEES